MRFPELANDGDVELEVLGRLLSTFKNDELKVEENRLR